MVMSRMLKMTRAKMPIVIMPIMIRKPPNAAVAMPIFRLFPVNAHIISRGNCLL